MTILLTDGTAESLPVPSKSIDTIVSTLVLCSVEDPEAAIREWRRVLKPRGTVLLIEHLRSEHPRRAWFQDLITPVWRRIAANCHPNRETLGTIGRGDFNFQESERLALGAPWIQPIVAGIATPR
jgi:ubiquinone/menaquinone biosynthesis C-methylase UbiE